MAGIAGVLGAGLLVVPEAKKSLGGAGMALADAGAGTASGTSGALSTSGGACSSKKPTSAAWNIVGEMYRRASRAPNFAHDHPINPTRQRSGATRRRIGSSALVGP